MALGLVPSHTVHVGAQWMWTGVLCCLAGSVGPGLPKYRCWPVKSAAPRPHLPLPLRVCRSLEFLPVSARLGFV